MRLEAVQVLRSIDDHIVNGRNNGEVKKIQTVYEPGNGPSLKEVLLCEGVKDLPILVFSIAGKTRGGKSFLLNLMLKYLEYLEKQQVGDWSKGIVNNCFSWRHGIESVTRGMWIYPKIFILKDSEDNKVGVMLMDMEGLYDGEATDGEIIAMSGISAAISYFQMFNLKEKITSDYLESVVRNLIRGIEELNVERQEELREDYKFMFVVRDWIGEESYSFGLEGGRDYIQYEKTRGSNQSQQLWTMIQSTFHNIECFLLPHPGREVSRPAFTQSGKLEMLDDIFLKEVKKLVEHLFQPGNLHSSSTSLTGQDIFRILNSIDGKIADEDLAFLNIFTDHANHTRVEKWKDSFKEILADVTLSRLPEAKSEMFAILLKAEQQLYGRSQATLLAEVTKALENGYNQKVIEICFQQYKNSFHEEANIEKQQREIWPDRKRMLQKNLCGSNITRENFRIDFIKQSAAFYYKLLKGELQRTFKSKCLSKKTLKECAGLDDKEMKSFKECEDFTNDVTNKEVVYPMWLKGYQELRNELTNILLQHIVSITGISLEVLKTLRRKQYEHFESFTLLNHDSLNLDCIPKDKKLEIAKKVGYAMFGPPEHLSKILSQPSSAMITAQSRPGNLFTTSAASAISDFFKGFNNQLYPNTGYSKIEESKIWPVVKEIISLCGTTNIVKFSCLFIVYDNKDNSTVNVPIFRVQSESTITYIDSNCRQYADWNDFLTSNSLPDVIYCYPLSVSYTKKEGFSIAFSFTPASKTTTKVLKTGDVVGKCVTGAGAIAGCAVVFGAASVVVSGIAIVGGVVGGVYGAVRGVQKIVDKKKHSEPIKNKDVLIVVGNGISVVGAVGMAACRTFAAAAEGTAFILGTRAAAGLSSMTSITTFFNKTDDTAELISLIAEIEDNSLKILFYFGTTCSKDALEVIRKSLKLGNNKNTAEILLALLENNCIQFATETGTGSVTVKKYVTQNTANLVTSILKSVSSNVRDTVKDYCDIHTVFQGLVNEVVGKRVVANKLQDIMRKMLIRLHEEMGLSRSKFLNLLCLNLNYLQDGTSGLQVGFDKLESEQGHFLASACRFLIWSLISEVRKANYFINNIDHQAVNLRGFYLKDVLYHPVHEISMKVKMIVDQTEAALDFSNANVGYLDYFSAQVLKIIKQGCEKNWSDNQFSACLVNLSKDMVEQFGNTVKCHQGIVKKEENISCNDLDLLTEEIGLEEYNYGSWVCKKVGNELEVDVDCVEAMTVGRQQQSYRSVIPAWSGILDNLYYYQSMPPIRNKLELIKELENIQEENYSRVLNMQDFNLIAYLPCDETLTSFVVYSESTAEYENGFIWMYKENQPENSVE